MESKKIIEILKQFNGNNTYKKIFINGSWGIGKSYYTNEYCKKYGDNVVYITLFGKTNFDSILEALNNELIKKVKKIKKYAKKAKKFFSHFKTSISFYGISISSSFIKNKNLIQEFSDLLEKEELIIIIDDLERKSANIPIEDIMGLIEELSTIEKVKIVLIGDEENVNDEKDKKIWKRFKEKIVEKEYKIDCFSFDAIESLIVEKLKEYIPEKILNDFIYSFLKKHQVKNLRTINKSVNLFLEITKNYLLKKYDENVMLTILKNCMAVAIEFNEELYKPDETKEDTSKNDIWDKLQNNDSDISSRISNHYFNENSIFYYDVEESILDYVIKIYNSEIDDNLISSFNNILNSFVEKKKQEKSIFYLSTEQITIKIKKIYNDIKSERYKIVTIEELIDDLYTLLNWNDVLNLGFKHETIFTHTKNILFEQYYDLNKEEYQNKIDTFNSLINESNVLNDFIDNYNKEVQKMYFKDKTNRLLQKYKINDLNTDYFNYFKWKFNQPHCDDEKKYFASICEQNNFLLPKLDAEIELCEWRWTHIIWEIYLNYLGDGNKKKLNDYVNKIKKKKGKKILEYRINILQKRKPLV